jgi:hypothetical protein
MPISSPTIPAQAQLEWLVAGNPQQASLHFEDSFGAPTVAEYKAAAEPRTCMQISIAETSEFESTVAAGLMAPVDPARDRTTELKMSSDSAC